MSAAMILGAERLALSSGLRLLARGVEVHLSRLRMKTPRFEAAELHMNNR